VRFQAAARSLIVAVPCAILVFALFFEVIRRFESEHHEAFLWVLNLFTSLPSEASWVLGNSLYALLFGVVIACVVGLPIGLLAGHWANAAGTALMALLPSVGLMAWLIRDDPWHLLGLGVATCGAPILAWWSSKLRGQRAP
jgi:ABC-type nitrate/sulfonate/bicarbonate transport system permease component